VRGMLVIVVNYFW